METPRQLIWPNVVIGVGITPLVFWAVVLAWALSPQSNVAEGILLVLVAGPVAYVLSLAVCGAGFLWADRVVRTAHVEKPRSTQMLVKFVAGILLLPWVVLPVIGAIWAGK